MDILQIEQTRAALALIPTLVFDLEGTLVENMPYEEALQHISNVVGVPLIELIRRYREEWRGLDEAMSYHQGLVVGSNEKGAIRVIYDTFSKEKSHPTVVPGGLEILKLAQARGQRLICWTRGKAELQAKALAASDLEPFFHSVVIVPEKNAAIARQELLPKLDGCPFAIIGDSYMHDIIPLRGLAAVRVWISGSKANGYIPRPIAIAVDVTEIASVQQLLPV